MVKKKKKRKEKKAGLVVNMYTFYSFKCTYVYVCIYLN